MLVTFLLSWLLAVEPACRPACASDRAHAITQHAPPAACGDGIPTRPPSASPEILSFEASWCAPCQEMKSILARLKRSGVRVRYVDVDREPEVARKHQIRSIPTFVNVTDGREVRRVVGVCSERALTDLAGAAASPRAASPGTNELAPGAAQAEMLVRARYELDAKKAEALDAFLERFAAEKVEVQRTGADVVITASPEVQQALGRFIMVLGGSTSKTTACATHHDSPKAQAIGDCEECTGRAEYRKVAERYLGSRAWTLDDDCGVLRFDRRMIFFKDWEALGDGTAFRFRPFAMITWQKGRREQDPVRFASDSAVLRFQSPYHLENPQHGELIGGSLEGNVRIYGATGTVEARAHDFHFSEDQLQSRSDVQSDCESACGPGCTNSCGGKCATACEDGVPCGVAVPDAPGCPLVPPVWMPQARSERLMFGTGVNSSAGLVGRVILDEPAVPRRPRVRGIGERIHHNEGPVSETGRH